MKTTMINFNAILCLLFFYSSISNATLVNGRIIIETNTDSLYSIKLQLNTDTGLDDMGGATIVVSYDTASLFFPSLPEDDIDYSFHNFTSGNYSAAKVTKPFSNKLWLNIELNSDNNGFVVSGSGDWTNLVTLNFKRKTSNNSNLISWESDNNFWAVYDGNNRTRWLSGDFINLPTSINEEKGIPENFELVQNYPNPFNPSTKIGFNLKENGNVKLTVYNTLGEEIEELINSYMPQGSHEKTFIASNLPSGIYFYKLEIDNRFSDIKKMVLLK